MDEQENESTGRMSLRLPRDLAQRIRRLAHENERTLNAEVIRAVRAYVEREEGEGR